MFFFNWNDQKKNNQAPNPVSTPAAAPTPNPAPAPTPTMTPDQAPLSAPTPTPVAMPTPVTSMATDPDNNTTSTTPAGYVAPKWQIPVEPSVGPSVEPALYEEEASYSDEKPAEPWQATKPVQSSFAQPQGVSQSATDGLTPNQVAPVTEDMSDYVDAYVPPQHLKHTPWTEEATLDDLQNSSGSENNTANNTAVADTIGGTTSTVSSTSGNLSNHSPLGDDDDTDVDSDQSLEAQNIFHLLGVEDGEESEKEKFLDELQQVVWDDFVENDSVLLLTEDEHEAFVKIIDRKDVPTEQIQEEALVYLEKLIPDLEEVLLEKALGLKRDMVMERVSGMKEFYASNPDSLQVIAQAESLFSQDKWLDGANMLNTLK